jgi:hypothetical protein
MPYILCLSKNGEITDPQTGLWRQRAPGLPASATWPGIHPHADRRASIISRLNLAQLPVRTGHLLNTIGIETGLQMNKQVSQGVLHSYWTELFWFLICIGGVVSGRHWPAEFTLYGLY